MIYYSALLCSTILRSGISYESKATLNVPENDTRDSIKNLSGRDEVNIIVKTKATEKGAFSALSMSLQKVNVNIEKAGIIGATVSMDELEDLKKNRNVEYVEIDYPQYVLDDTAGYVRKLAEETPYGIPMVLEDMDFWKKLDPPTGSIKVCVADTGYDFGHVDLPKGSDVTGSDSSSNGSWNSDGHGHGTHCSGTVAGLGENNKGVVGVIPDNADGNFQLVIGKALSDSGSGSNSGVLGAVQSCVDDGAKVISLSLGGGGYSGTTNDFYNNLYEKEDILFVAAAGNGGSSSKLYPASYPALMSVAAIDSNKNKASFSQYNDQVEISAPGVSVKSSLPDDKYASWSGTSMATPHVAGVAGLLWMHFPDCKNYQIRNVLLATAEDLGDDGCDIKYGHGLVPAKKAYELLSQGNCGGNLGKVHPPVGGCEQAIPDGPTAAPTPECTSDSECDDGDSCTLNTCNNGLCVSTPDCASCGKSKVDVEITIDNYGEETTYDIKNSSGTSVMKGSGWPANSVNSFWQCFSSGSYTFKITDAYGDGICCSYGNGGYSVKVNDQQVASGGQFGSEETKSFQVGAAPPTTPTSAPIPAPSSPTSAPNNGVPTSYPTHTPPTMYPTHTVPTMYPTGSLPTDPVPTPYPTDVPPTLFPTGQTCKPQGESCSKHNECCGGKCNLKKELCRK